MELKDLTGEHVLDAVDFSSEQVKTWGDEFEACNVMRFRLGGKVYMAIEDPSDGYRSSMRELAVGDWPMKNVFPPVRVVCRHRTVYEYGGSSDVLELIDVATGKTVVEVGTDNDDDYYPSFVANFQPENMTPNVGAEPTVEAGGDWPRRDDDNGGPERPGGPCRSGSARASC